MAVNNYPIPTDTPTYHVEVISSLIFFYLTIFGVILGLVFGM